MPAWSMAGKNTGLLQLMVHSETAPLPHNSPWLDALHHVRSYELLRLLGLYAVLVAYMGTLTFILAQYLSEYYTYYHMIYDPARFDTYLWVCFLTPLTVLPAGTRLVTGSQFIFPIFMTYVGLSSPVFLINYVVPNIFWSIYFCLFISYFIIAISTRLLLKPIPSPFTEKSYAWLLIGTVLLFATIFGIGMVQNFHVVDFAHLYEVRYSDTESSAAFVQRFTDMYIFSFGGFFIGLSLFYRRFALAGLFLLVYVICYGLVQYKTAILAPVWFIYLYLFFRFFRNVSTTGFYLALTAPFWIGMALYFLFPNGRTLDGNNVAVWGYLNLVIFRQYAVSANALGIYYNFFQTHTHTLWSQITGLDFFLRYPYGDHTVAIEMQRRYDLGNYNASFLATEGIASYGYQAIPLASAALAFVFILLNTATRSIPPRTLVIMMVMPCLMLNERPLSTSLLTGGIIFLIFYLAWLPRRWMASRRAD